MEQIFSTGLSIVGLYLLLGLIFLVPFYIKGMKTIDPDTMETSIYFKLLILPGIISFWLPLMIKWIKVKKAG